MNFSEIGGELTNLVLTKKCHQKFWRMKTEIFYGVCKIFGNRGRNQKQGQFIIASGWMDAPAHLIFIYIMEHPLRTSPKKVDIFDPPPPCPFLSLSARPPPPKKDIP